MKRILPTHYFHVVFTVPSELRSLFMFNRELLFQALFASASEALLELGRDPRLLGADLGFTSVLHTWTRELHFHPHIHSIVTGGGLSPDGERWVGTRPSFLLPIRALGALFRGKLLDRIKQAHARGLLRLDGAAARFADRMVFNRLCDKLYGKRWIVYSKPPFGGPEEVFRYLGRYTHRVGISNRRLLSLDADHVTFGTKGGQTCTVTPDQFLERFLLHVLPPGFVKIRHYGLFAPGNVSTKLELARQRLGPSPSETPPERPATPALDDFRDLLLALTGVDLRVCRRCGRGPVVRGPLDPEMDLHGLPPVAPDTS